jgi:N-dimethylarginine dimethylaminohydrolase
VFLRSFGEQWREEEVITIQKRKNLYAIALIAFSILWMILLVIPATRAATPTITLTPTSQAPGGSVTVTGTGFGATIVVGIGFRAEVNVINEVMDTTGPYGVGTGPYHGNITSSQTRHI